MREVTLKALMYAAERARVYFDHQVSGRGSLNGHHDDLSIGRLLTSALKDAVQEEATVEPEEVWSRR